MSPEATPDGRPRLFRRAVLREPGHLDDAVERQAAVRGGRHAVPLPADLRPPGPGCGHQPDLGPRAVERERLQSAHTASGGVAGAPNCANNARRRGRRWQTTSIAASVVGPGVGQDGRHPGGGFVRHRRERASRAATKRVLDLLDKDDANTPRLRYQFNQGIAEPGDLLPARHGSPDDHTRRTASTFQDSFTRGQLTLQGALRYDHASSFAPSELNGDDAERIVPQPQPITIPEDGGCRRLQRPHAAHRRRL